MSKSVDLHGLKVFPVGVQQFTEFEAFLGKIKAALPSGKTSIGAGDLLAMATKFTPSDVVDLVSKCTTPPLKESALSLDETLEVIAAWFDLSFAKDAKSPLVRAVRAGVDIATTAMATLYEATLTTSDTSAAAGSEPSMTSPSDSATDGPTADGPCPSLLPQSAPAVASTPTA